MALDAEPDQRRALVDDPSLVAGAVEEVLRWDAPVQGLARVAVEDVTIAGGTVPAGSRVQLRFGSANRDEREFADADRFDVRRTISRHVGLGHGIHYCLGASLARLEGRVLLEELLSLVPEWSVEARPAASLSRRSWSFVARAVLRSGLITRVTTGRLTAPADASEGRDDGLGVAGRRRPSAGPRPRLPTGSTRIGVVEVVKQLGSQPWLGGQPPTTCGRVQADPGSVRRPGRCDRAHDPRVPIRFDEAQRRP